jgi:hypothetical protein
MKKETLEEAALSFLPHSEVEHDTDFITGFEFGAKWQAERMYSEEDMKQFGLYLGNNLKKLKGKSIDELFTNFKQQEQ